MSHGCSYATDAFGSSMEESCGWSDDSELIDLNANHLRTKMDSKELKDKYQSRTSWNPGARKSNQSSLRDAIKPTIPLQLYQHQSSKTDPVCHHQKNHASPVALTANNSNRDLRLRNEIVYIKSRLVERDGRRHVIQFSLTYPERLRKHLAPSQFLSRMTTVNQLVTPDFYRREITPRCIRISKICILPLMILLIAISAFVLVFLFCPPMEYTWFRAFTAAVACASPLLSVSVFIVLWKKQYKECEKSKNLVIAQLKEFTLKDKGRIYWYLKDTSEFKLLGESPNPKLLERSKSNVTDQPKRSWLYGDASDKFPMIEVEIAQQPALIGGF